MEPSVELIIKFLNKHVSSNRSRSTKLKVVPPGGNTHVNQSYGHSQFEVKVSKTLFSQFFATTTSTDPKKVSQPSCLASFTRLDNLIPYCAEG